MIQLKDFATLRYPLRASCIPALFQCPWKVIMEFLQLYQRDGGMAAQTGTATHKAIQHWHKQGKEVSEAVETMRATGFEYPAADLLEAERLFRAYTKDPRNQDTRVVETECLVTGSYKGVYLEGHIDQIREKEGKTWEIMDVKTSRLPGLRIRNEHLYQLAVYAWLASKVFKREVLPGAVIMVRDYDSPRNPVFYPYNLSFTDVERLMDMVVTRIQEVRDGKIVLTSGDHCQYCVGVNECVKKLKDYETSRKT